MNFRLFKLSVCKYWLTLGRICFTALHHRLYYADFRLNRLCSYNNYYAICSIATTGSFFKNLRCWYPSHFPRYFLDIESVIVNPSAKRQTESGVYSRPTNAHKAICVWRNVVCKKSPQRDLKYVDGIVELGLHVISMFGRSQIELDPWDQKPFGLLPLNFRFICIVLNVSDRVNHNILPFEYKGGRLN